MKVWYGIQPGFYLSLYNAVVDFDLKYFCMEKGSLKANIPGAQESHVATETAPCLAGTSCCCGKRPATPAAKRPGRDAGSSKTVPPPRFKLCLHLAAVTPSVQAPLSKASLGGRETPRAWEAIGRRSGEKLASLRLQEQALSLR